MKKASILATAILLALCTKAIAQTPQPALTIPLSPYAGNEKLTVVHATVYGHEGTFLFDTGEGVSILTPDFAKQVGCKPWGRITGFRMTGQRLGSAKCDVITFNWSGRTFTAPSVGTGDINKFMPEGAPHLDGSLGLDIFAHNIVTVEPHRAIVIESPESLAARLKNAREIKVRLVRDVEGLSLSVNAAVQMPQGLAWMELDTGNTSGTLLISNDIAPFVGLKPDTKAATDIHMTLPGGIPVEAPARSRDLIMDGNLGTAFLNNWNLTLDLAQGRGWLSKPGA